MKMRVSDHIHALRIPFKINTGTETLERFVYSFIIFGPEICLIDTGVENSQELIFDYIKQTGRNPQDISTIILTHSHLTILGLLRKLKS
jgi:glyoxylase-like metal-dependent hydrolase (beta-lactamase superfamily II)